MSRMRGSLSVSNYPKQDYCGCCGAKCSGMWCERCILHLRPMSSRYAGPWTRTYYAWHKEPCPYQFDDPSPVYVSELLTSCHYRVCGEKELQAALAVVLETKGLTIQREVKINDGKIDILCGSVGIEVKIKGSYSDIVRQLHRYAQSEKITSLILASTKHSHRLLIHEFNGKKLYYVKLEIGD